MAMHIVKQSRKFVKPSTPTPESLRNYKIGFVDELAPEMDVSMALFFSGDVTKFVTKLEKSLEKTLTRLYPLAGRYVKEIQTVECNDKGAEFVHARANIKLEDFLLDAKVNNVKLVDDLIPVLSNADDHSILLSAQVTMFECGGVALGFSIPHRIADASTLSTFMSQWAAMCLEENDDVHQFTAGFNSPSLFPARGLRPLWQRPPSIPTSTTHDHVQISNNNIVTTKLSFNDNMISNLIEKANACGIKCSKGILAKGLILKAFIGIDRAIHGYQRECVLVQTINLRDKFASLIPNDSCGNLWGMFATECRMAAEEATQDFAHLIRDSTKKTINNYSKVRHDDEEGQTMVLNSFLHLANIITPNTNVINSTSWCNFDFYDADFGFGKPIWASGGTRMLFDVKNSMYLMDGIGGNAVEAYVCLEAKHVPRLEETLGIKAAFAA